MIRSTASYFKKKITFLCVPHEGLKRYHFRIPLFAFHGGLLVLGLLLTWALLLIARDAHYRWEQLSDRRMKNHLKEMSEELQNDRALLSQMSRMDSQFRKLLKIGDRRKVLETGAGGPTEEDSTKFSKLLLEKNDELLNKVQTSLNETNKAAARQEASFKEIRLFLDKQRSILAFTPSIWPVNGWITSGFGKRASPLTGEKGRHMGVDIGNEINTPIRVTADGMVIYAGWNGSFGRVVVVEHGYGFSTYYGHCARVDVSVGDEVKRGQVVGYLGSTGRSTGSHVHYEVRLHGVPVNPEKYLPQVE